MIGQMAVRVTADRANFPLGALFVRRGSAANVALVGVPVRAGVDVESVTVRVTNVDGASADFAARQYGAVWVVDIPASHLATVGNVPGGVAVYATGTGADGETARTWNIGVGDLDVLPADADAPAPTPGQTFWPLRMFDAAPTAPTKYNAYIDGGELKIWNGTAWIAISGGGETPIAPSTDPAAQGKPADAKATGDALAGKLAKTAAGYAIEETLDGLTITLSGDGGGEKRYDLTKQGNDSNYTLVRLAELDGKADAADLRYRIAEAGYATTGARLPDEASIWYNGVDVTDDGTLSWNSETDTWVFGTDEGLVAWDEEGSFEGGAYEESVVLKVNGSTVDSFNLLVPRSLADRTENLIMATDETSIDIELPAPVEEPTDVRRARDFFLDIDNSVNANDIALEFTGLGQSYAFVAAGGDSVGEIMTIAGYGTGSQGDGEIVRIYFTETPHLAVAGSLPVIQVARVTLGDFVTSTTPASQGGN